MIFDLLADVKQAAAPHPNPLPVSQCSVEVDGATHSTPGEIEADRVKERYLQKRGFKVLRACNSDVYETLDGVLEYLYRALTEEA